MDIELEKQLNKYKSEFHKIYSKEILPALDFLEKERIKQLHKMYLIVTPFWLIFLGSIYAAFINPDILAKTQVLLGIMPVISFVSLFLAIFITCKHNSDFIKKIKLRFTPAILKVFKHIKWTEKSRLEDSKLSASELFAAFNRRTDDDSFIGKYKEVDFTLTETNLRHESGSGKNRTVINIFRGIIFEFSCNKTIHSKTLVVSRNDRMVKSNNYIWPVIIIQIFLGAFLGGNSKEGLITMLFILVPVTILLLFLHIRKPSKSNQVLNEVFLEDPIFTKKYRVYSWDQTEARYLLTTSFMERLNNVETSFGSDKIKCVFETDGSLIFAISTKKNLFEIGNLFSKINKSKNFQTFFDEIVSVLMLVDYFKLDEKIGL